MAILKTSAAYSHCSLVHQKRILNEGKLIAMQSKLSACSIDTTRCN